MLAESLYLALKQNQRTKHLQKTQIKLIINAKRNFYEEEHALSLLVELKLYRHLYYRHYRHLYYRYYRHPRMHYPKPVVMMLTTTDDEDSMLMFTGPAPFSP